MNESEVEFIFENHQIDPEMCRLILLQARENNSVGQYQHFTKHREDLLPERDALDFDAIYFSVAEIQESFSGLTLGAYRRIKNLFCDPIGRSIFTVDAILQKEMAKRGAEFTNYFALKVVCRSLQARQDEQLGVDIRYEHCVWQLIILKPDISLVENNQTYQPCIPCLVDTTFEKVLAYRICRSQRLSDEIALTLFDGIAYERTPSLEGNHGLVWILPKFLRIRADIPEVFMKFLEKLGVVLIKELDKDPFSEKLQENWTRHLPNAQLSSDILKSIFDVFIHHVSGENPTLRNLIREKEYGNLQGYSRDPAMLFPALRWLLPLSDSTINTKGELSVNGLHYHDPILVDFQGQFVSVLIHPDREYLAWVLLDGDMLCTAKAKELKRRDGSYRMNRMEH